MWDLAAQECPTFNQPRWGVAPGPSKTLPPLPLQAWTCGRIGRPARSPTTWGKAWGMMSRGGMGPNRPSRRCTAHRREACEWRRRGCFWRRCAPAAPAACYSPRFGGPVAQRLTRPPISQLAQPHSTQPNQPTTCHPARSPPTLQVCAAPAVQLIPRAGLRPAYYWLGQVRQNASAASWHTCSALPYVHLVDLS